MAWDSTVTAEADSAWATVQHFTRMAPDLIRAVVGAQLEMVAAGVLARAGQLDSAKRVVNRVRSRINADQRFAGEPFGPELLELESSVRLVLGEREAASLLLSEYLRQYPDRRPQLSRSRRYQGLPVQEVTDGKARAQ
jgi:hypothetical protein